MAKFTRNINKIKSDNDQTVGGRCEQGLSPFVFVIFVHLGHLTLSD